MKPKSFDFDRYGSAFLAKYLHTLRTTVSAQCDELFEAYDISAPSHCASLLLHLKAKGKAGLTSLADELGYSHQLINQRLVLLEKASFVKRVKDASDRRRSLAVLTRKGVAEAEKIGRVMPLICSGIEDMFEHIGMNLIDVLNDAQAALNETSIAERASAMNVRNE